MEERLLKVSEAAKRLGVTIQTLRNWEKSGQLHPIRFHAKGNRMYRESDILALFKKNQFHRGLGPALEWAGTKDPKEPPEAFYCGFRDQFSARLWKEDTTWKKIYGEEKGALISAVVGEIGNNSFDHNLGKWPDVPGIWFEWSEFSRQIVLADRGIGIFTSLKRVRPDLKNHQEALHVAFSEVVTGRAPEPRGNGLKFVKSTMIRHKMDLSFQSGNAHIKIENGRVLEIEKTEHIIPGCLAIITPQHV